MIKGGMILIVRYPGWPPCGLTLGYLRVVLSGLPGNSNERSVSED